MASPPNESRTLASYLDFDEDVDYGSDTDVPGDEGIASYCPVSEVRPLTSPNPIVERAETTAPVAQHHAKDLDEYIITKPLDEQHGLILHREERALRCAHTQTVNQNWIGYVFSTPDVEQRLHQTEDRSLSTWAIAREDLSPEDIAFRKVLHESYLEPFLTTQG